MRLSFKTSKKIKANYQLTHNIILDYLKESEYYRVVDNQNVLVTFVEDEFKDRPASRSDYYTKVNSGKFVLVPDDENTDLNLYYSVSIFWEFIILSITLALAICIDITAIILTIVFLINFGIKIFYINFSLLDSIFDEQLENS